MSVVDQPQACRDWLENRSRKLLEVHVNPIGRGDGLKGLPPFLQREMKMKILNMRLVTDQSKNVKAIFDFQFNNFFFRGWKVIESNTAGIWIAPPRYKDTSSDRFVATVTLPPEIKDELDALALAAYGHT